jgi:hypothetical protein
VKVLKLGTYKLANEDGEELTNAWNIQQLRSQQPCKHHQFNKRATRLSPETQVTLGGYYGGHPPQKNGPIFRKKEKTHAR